MCWILILEEETFHVYRHRLHIYASTTWGQFGQFAKYLICRPHSLYSYVAKSSLLSSVAPLFDHINCSPTMNTPPAAH